MRENQRTGRVEFLQMMDILGFDGQKKKCVTLPSGSKNKKMCFLYSALSSPLNRSKRFTLFALPDRPAHSDTNSASPGNILAMQQLRATTKSLTFPPLSLARYSFIQLSQLGRQWRERKYPIFETVAKGDSNPGSLDCESGILPLSHRAPYYDPYPLCVSRRIDTGRLDSS